MWSSSVGVITLALLLFGGVASAESCVFSSAPAFQLKSATVEWAMKIAGGHSCIRGLRSGAASSSTVLGPGFSYEAKADYQGPDTFTLRVSGTLMRTRGTSEILVTVDVGGK